MKEVSQVVKMRSLHADGTLENVISLITSEVYDTYYSLCDWI
jgi:hypothetical protein